MIFHLSGRKQWQTLVNNYEKKVLSQLPMNIHRNYQRNLSRVIYLVFVQKCQAILNKGFVLLWTNSLCLNYAYSLES